MRDGFVFYRSFIDAIKILKEEKRLAIIMAIIEYALDDKEPTNLDNEQMLIFVLAKPQIDANKKRAEDGKKGGRPKKTIGFEENNHRLLNEKPKEKEKDKEKDKDKEYKRKNLAGSFGNFMQNESTQETKNIWVN